MVNTCFIIELYITIESKGTSHINFSYTYINLLLFYRKPPPPPPPPKEPPPPPPEENPPPPAE